MAVRLTRLMVFSPSFFSALRFLTPTGVLKDGIVVNVAAEGALDISPLPVSRLLSSFVRTYLPGTFQFQNTVVTKPQSRREHPSVQSNYFHSLELSVIERACTRTLVLAENVKSIDPEGNSAQSIRFILLRGYRNRYERNTGILYLE